MEHGKITAWHSVEGDEVCSYDLLLDVQTYEYVLMRAHLYQSLSFLNTIHQIHV